MEQSPSLTGRIGLGGDSNGQQDDGFGRWHRDAGFALKRLETPMSGRVTIRHIAEHAGVSVGTVSHVLNGSARVRPNRRARVEAAIASLGFVPSRLGSSLRRQRTDIIGMIIPDIGNPFFPSVVRGVQDATSGEGRQLMLCNSDNDPAKQRSYLEVIRSYRPAGLIVIPADEAAFAPFGDAAIPIPFPMVCIDRQPIGWRGDSVVSANHEGGASAAGHLLELGHRRFGIISGPHTVNTARDRVAGFVAALGLAGLERDAWKVREGAFDRQSGFEATLALLKATPRPTAIFAGNDLMAIGAILAFREAGLQCPADISVVGFDDLDIAALTQPALTSISQPGYAIGQAAANLLLRRLEGDARASEQLVLPTTLKTRGSTGPAH
jgi:DNA-binding LacI/PurR family transcriptional regulator